MTDPASTGGRWNAAAFWLVGGVLVAYVAMFTGQRENAPFADAWEHHRVILALMDNLWHPGNPTFDSDLPSIRYSPYFIVQAVICRATGIDAYRMLSWAAALNTILLVLAVRALLRSFGEQASGAAALVALVALYGKAPEWAGSHALSDLPWHQVNPSAFGLPLVMFAWALFRRFDQRGWKDFALPCVILLCAEAMLDHAMTGAFGMATLLVMALVSTSSHRRRLLAGFAVTVAVVAGVCACWPWYSFIEAALSTRDREYWFWPKQLYASLYFWPAPAFLCAWFATPLWRRELVRVSLAAALFSYALGIVAIPIESPMLARLPLCGILFLQLPAALFVHEIGLFRAGAWTGRFRTLASGSVAAAAQTLVEVGAVAIVIYCLAPQMLEIAHAPHLARAYIAPLTHREDKQIHLKQRFDALLKPVGKHDVVLSDPATAWPIPSSRGRIVAALHYELFIPDQPQRDRDVAAFLGGATDAECEAILTRYHVKWIVLDGNRLGPRDFAALYEATAVVGRDTNLYLMDAEKWLRARQGKRVPAVASPAGAGSA